MKTRLIFCLWIYCTLLIVYIPKAVANTDFNENLVGIDLSTNDIPFGSVGGSSEGSRSLIPDLPISVDIDMENHCVQLSFYEPLGIINLSIMQNGMSIYSSDENVVSFGQKEILLSNFSGCFLIEIKGNNGAYAYGWFEH